MAITPRAPHVHRFGPDAPPRVLAVHGLTGHGRRWRTLAEQHLADVPIAAPDLLGHGRSPSAAPWSIEANVAALAGWLDGAADGPVLVVGHSFGGAIALALAAARPDLVSGLVLLDPAVGLDGEWMREVAEATLVSPDYSSREEARLERVNGQWADVDPAELARDLDEHLVRLPTGRWGWRICLPAVVAYWSDLARPPVLPPAGTPTALVRARRVDPPYVTAELVAGLTDRLGADFELLEWDCYHMVAHALPGPTAALIRRRLG